MLKNINWLEGCFDEPARSELQTVFAFGGILDEDTLNERLRSILQHEKSQSIFFEWKTSPSGTNHLIISSPFIVLVNIYGFLPLMSSALFLDGDLDIRNIHWMEQDHLVSFDAYHIVHDCLQRGICHYSNDDDSFFLLGEPIHGIRRS